jgi:hypothetical protein
MKLTMQRAIVLAAAALLCAASSAFAQTKGRFSIGGSFTVNATTDSDVGTSFGVGPVVRLNPRKGFGAAGALNWLRADLEPPAGSGDFARLRMRPLLGGVSYGIGSGRVLTSLSIGGGPSFNKADFHGYAAEPGESIEADNSVAIRPGIGITWTVAPRVAIVGFAGYLYNRPDIVYRNRLGQEITDRWKADAVVLSVGAVYSIF